MYYDYHQVKGQLRKKLDRERRWIGHKLRKPIKNFNGVALNWNQQGKRMRDRSMASWRRDMTEKMKALGKSWKDLEKIT